MKNRIEQANGGEAAPETPNSQTGMIIGPTSAAHTDQVILSSAGQHGLEQVKVQSTVADVGREQGQPHEIPPKNEAEQVTPAPKTKDALVLMFEAARIPQDVSRQEIGCKQIETIPVRRPKQDAWFMTHPDSDQYWYQGYVIELKDENETYFLSPAIAGELVANGEQMVTRRMLVLACTRAGTPFIWPIGMPADDGKWNSWPKSAMIAAKKAQTKWVRLLSDRALGAYIPMIRQPDSVEPSWPPLPMAEILAVAFRGKVISDLNHPVIAELQGVSFAPADPMAQVNAILNNEG